jgi:hypothetical protein
MSQQLINHSPDLKRLRDEGYEVCIKGGYLVIHHIPYVNSQRQICYGTLISTLALNNNITIKPDTHVINFMGEHPCNKDGTIITAIQHSNPNQSIGDGLIMNFLFSNKPPTGYNDYYDKVTRYVEIISSPAISMDPSVTAKTFTVVKESNEDAVFQYLDTNSSRANIYQFHAKFKGQRVGIIGLGGTGSYILDLVAKTPVDEIHLFDGDVYLQHNSFRSPGATSIETLDKKLAKVDYYTSVYSLMHNGIKPHALYLMEDNLHLLNGLTYVFLCIDRNAVKGKILTHLRQQGIVFLDTGLGVNIAEDNLVGTVRLTIGTPSKLDHLTLRIGTEDLEENEYSTNIQIADLNALNAALAVIKWKKLIGFYQDLKEEHHSTYTINTAQLLHEDCTI